MATRPPHYRERRQRQAPTHTIAGPCFPDSFEVRSLLDNQQVFTLVGAIELISPSNKDRPEERRQFATKCASYLHQGISLVILDIVTNRRANLHNETMRLMEAASDMALAAEVNLYSAAYRPVQREERAEIEMWTAPARLAIRCRSCRCG